ncbi:MAG: OsmC family protein [Candidatus Eisenbacteria bacterium]
MVETRAKVALETVSGTGLRFVASNDAGLAFALDSGPAATAPSATVALLAALGGCAGMDVIAILRKKRQRVTGYAIELIGQRREEHPRAYTAIEVVHRVRGVDLSPSAVEEAIRLSDTKYCSIHATLSPGVAITSRFEIIADEA